MILKNNNPDLDLLTAAAINKPKEFLYTHPEYKLNFWQKLKFKYFLFKYHQGYAVAAIIKQKEFFGLDFYVNKNVLIPRPDTELMVENAIMEISASAGDINLIDVGTGSGCIPISILKNTDKKIKTFAIDISSSAIRVAKKNAKKHKVKINFLHNDLLKGFSPPNDFKHLIITANLPYLTAAQFKSEKSIQKEPRMALVADNKTGLSIYERLFQQIQKIKNHKITIFLEIDPGQTNEISALIKKYFPTSIFEIKKDLSGLDRLVIIKI